MMNVIKKGLLYSSAVIISILIMMYVDFANKMQISPKEVYKVYLDGKEIGNIKNKKELEDYINDEQKDLKDKYDVKKVYVPSGVDIQKCITYEKEILTAKQANNMITNEKPFTIKGYKITVKSKTEGEDNLVINVIDKDIFDTAIRSVLQAFISEDEIDNFENDKQSEIADTGDLIEDIYIDQDITIKESFISVDEQIFTDVKTLTKYLLFGSLDDDEYYTVKEGDTIDSIAYDHKLATSEFLIVNPEFNSANNLLSVGQQVKVGLINPLVDVVVETHSVFNQESNFKTETKYDANMIAGIQEVEVQGQNGMDKITAKIKKVNGETTNVLIVSSEVLTPAVNKVVKVGTKSYGGSAVVASGSWAWPTISQYFISSYFGYRWGKIHEALDIAGSGEGSPIFAAGAGTVITAGKASSLGNHVVIDHGVINGNRYYTLYGHMRSLTVSAGQTVSKGQQIGTMGHTGFATGTHLHFGLYLNGYPYRGGTPTDPLKLYR